MLHSLSGCHNFKCGKETKESEIDETESFSEPPLYLALRLQKSAIGFYRIFWRKRELWLDRKSFHETL